MVGTPWRRPLRRTSWIPALSAFDFASRSPVSAAPEASCPVKRPRRQAAPSTLKSVPERPAFLAVGDSDNRSAFAAAVAPVASLSLMISMPLELPAPDANAPIGPGTPFPVAKTTCSALPGPDPAVAGVGAELVLSTNAKLYPQRLSFTLERE